MTNLHKMRQDFGVSPWLDNLSRDLITSGALAAYIEKGICGVTSNPSIFEKAFKESELYKEPIAHLRAQGLSAEDAYWQLAIEDIQSACDLLRPLYDQTSGDDGYVSLEVSPNLARDTEGTITQAKLLWERVDRPNVMIKIPATQECIPAISAVIASGINVNVTLIFSLHRYLEVIAAYISGLEQLADPRSVRSVASFFISRVDSEVDTQLKDPKHAGLAAVAQARAAYGIYLESFNQTAERWARLSAKGAMPQKPLWASTSTKNPLYPDLKYVDGLLTPQSVNTLPDVTVEAILDHAQFSPEMAVTPLLIEEAHETLATLQVAGIQMTDVSVKLEREGVEKFQAAFSAMLSGLEV